MQRLAKEVLAIAVRMGYPELNILDMYGGIDCPLYVLAEEVPQSSDQELKYMVGVYDMDRAIMNPRLSVWGIPTLERAQVVFEEMKRSGV